MCDLLTILEENYFADYADKATPGNAVNSLFY